MGQQWPVTFTPPTCFTLSPNWTPEKTAAKGKHGKTVIRGLTVGFESEINLVHPPQPQHAGQSQGCAAHRRPSAEQKAAARKKSDRRSVNPV